MDLYSKGGRETERDRDRDRDTQRDTERETEREKILYHKTMLAVCIMDPDKQ